MANVGLNLVDKVKNIPVQSLTDRQKQKLLEKLVDELKKGNFLYLEKTFEVIDHLPNSHLKSNIIYNIENALKGESKSLFEKEALLRYKTKDELLEIIFSNNITYNNYKLDIVKKILPTLNDLEINGLLIGCAYNKEIKEYILNNYNGKIQINTFNVLFEGRARGSDLVLFDKLSYENKIKVIKKLSYSEDEFIERIEELKEEDRLYLELSHNKEKITHISSEGFIKYINKYKDNEVFLYDKVVTSFSDVDLNVILQNINKESKVYSQIQSEIIYRQYSKLNDNEKKEYLLNLKAEIIDKEFYLFSKDIKVLSDIELLNKLKENRINNIHFAKYILNQFDMEQLKENDVKFSIILATDLNLFDLTLIDPNQSNEDKRVMALSLSNKLHREKENDEYKILLKNLLCSGVDVKLYSLNDIYGFEDIIDILKNNEMVASSLDYMKFNEPELIELKKYAFNNEDYLLRVLSLRDYDGNINNEYSKLQLEILSNIPNSYRYNNLPILSNINVVTDLVKTQNKQALLRILPNYGNNVNLFDKLVENGLDKQTLLAIDSSGKLLELYESINEENLNKINGYKGFVKSEFFLNILRIYENREQLVKLKESNPLIMLTMNYKFLDILEGKNLEYFARYEDLKSLYNLKGNSKQLVNKIVNRVLETREYQDEIISKCLHCLSNLSEEKISSLIEMDIDKVIYLMSKNSVVLKGDVSDFEQSEKEYCDNILKTSENIDECLDAFFREKCKMDLESAKRLARIYGSDVSKLKLIYSDNDKIIKSIDVLENIKKILQIRDRKQLIELYNKTKSANDILFYVNLEEILKLAYNNQILSGLYKPKVEDSIQPNVYEVDGDFNMIVSVIGAYVKNEESVDNPSENWNDKEKLVNHGICASLIANNNLSFAYDKNKLIYGFNSLEDSSLLKVASYDLYSSSNAVQVDSLKEEQYRTADEIIDNVREGHSELVIERREKISNNKRQPDYIVAVDTIRSMDIKAAKEFNIPIVLIKSEKIAFQESKKLFDLYQETIRNPSAYKIEKLINEYHNNYAGLLQINPKLNDKYFNPRKFKNMLYELIENIQCIDNQSQKEELLEVFLKTLNQEEKKRYLVNEKCIPFEFNDLKEKITSNESKEENIVLDMLNKLKNKFSKKDRK